MKVFVRRRRKCMGPGLSPGSQLNPEQAILVDNLSVSGKMDAAVRAPLTLG